MKKTCFFLCQIVCVLFISGCFHTTYKNVEEIEPVFRENMAAFERVAAVLEALDGIQEISGDILTAKERTSSLTDSEHVIQREVAGLSICSDIALGTEAEYLKLAEAVNALLEDVDVVSITFYKKLLRFNLYEESDFSEFPKVVYCLDAELGENDVLEPAFDNDGEILFLKDRWYANITRH